MDDIELDEMVKAVKREYYRKYREEHRAELNAKQRERYHKDSKIKDSRKKWRDAHPEKIKEANHRQDVRKGIVRKKFRGINASVPQDVDNEHRLFAERLLSLLNKNEMSGGQLARRIGVKPQTISVYIRGRGFPIIQIALKIAEVFGVTVEYLFGKDDNNDLHD